VKKSKKDAMNRRGFLKGAAAGAAALAATPQLAKAAPAAPPRPRVPLPSQAQLEAEAGPPPSVQGESRFIEHPNSDFMVDVIKTLNIEYLGSNAGSSFESLHESLINYGNNQMPEFLTNLHEESSVAMAHGYAKIEGKPMMVLLHGTVGLLHASMAIYQAYADRVPVYMIVGNHLEPRGGVNGYHSAQDMGALVRDFVKWDDEALSLSRFASSAVRAYKVAMTPPMGPVLISLDHDLQGRPLESGFNLAVPKLTMAAPPQGDSNAVREAARMLVDAERPAIVYERSARTQNGIDLLVELAEALQAPADGNDFMGFPKRHPLYGAGGPDYGADVTLALEVNDLFNASQAQSARGGRMISISSVDLSHGSNIRDFGRYAEVDLAIAADAEATLPALIEEVRRLTTSNRRTAFETRGTSLTAAHEEVRARDLERARHGWDASPISRARLAAEVWDQVKNDDWSLASPQRFLGSWPGRLWNMEKKHHYIGEQGAGGMGYGLPAAVGAALANRKYGRLTVNFNGDGDLNYAPGVLWTAVHHQIPLLTCVLNNRAYHAEVMFIQRNAGLHKRGEDNVHIGTTLDKPNIDYVQMAGAYGMYAEGPIENPNDLRPAVQRALARVRAGEPALLDVVTQPR